MNKVQDEKRQAVIAGLRELADWLEQNPQAPVPHNPDFQCNVMRAEDDTDGRAQVEEIAEAIGAPVKESDDRISATRMFGPITYLVMYIDTDSLKAYSTAASYYGAVQS